MTARTAVLRNLDTRLKVGPLTPQQWAVMFLLFAVVLLADVFEFWKTTFGPSGMVIEFGLVLGSGAILRLIEQHDPHVVFPAITYYLSGHSKAVWTGLRADQGVAPELADFYTSRRVARWMEGRG